MSLLVQRALSISKTVRVAMALAIAALSPGCSLFSAIGKVSSTFSEVTRSGEMGDPFKVPGYRVAAASPRALAAGAASIDITPPPGFPTGGHGPAGNVSRGYWMRLRSRAFYFEDARGRALALVSADLFAIPRGLPQRVAQLAAARLAQSGIEVPLPPEAVIIAATHTHHGPGNFLTARVYNQFGSSYPGFSSELFEFLAGRIADSLVDAARSARAGSGAIELIIHTHRVAYGLLRNRAPKAFMLNVDRDALLDELNDGEAAPRCIQEADEPAGGWETPECVRLRAVDRALTVLEVKRAGARVAALVFFAAHPTDLPAETPLYSPDFAGEAMASLEQRLGITVGFFNGAEGDVTLRRRVRDLRETIQFGELFAAEVGQALARAGQKMPGDALIHLRAAAWRPADEGSCQNARLAATPTFGAATLGGAEDDRTQLYLLGWRDGVRETGAGAQGVKLPALDSRILRGVRFSSEFAPPVAYPQVLPLALASIGDFTVAAVPLEASTAQGALLRHSLNLQHGRLEIIGLANEYASYCSSRDEYWAQDYMGASTLWGPDEGPYLACRLAELAGSPELSVPAAVPDAQFMPGVTPKDPFGLSFASESERPDEGLADVLLDSRRWPERRLPWFAWTEAQSEPFAQADNRRAEIWKRDDRGIFRVFDSDQGNAFLTIHLGKDTWSVIWLGPLLQQGLRGEFAFVIKFKGGRECSTAFSLSLGGDRPDRINRGSCEPFGTRSELSSLDKPLLLAGWIDPLWPAEIHWRVGCRKIQPTSPR